MVSRFALVAVLATALWVPLNAAAQGDHLPQRIQRVDTSPGPGRVRPQHAYFFGAPAYWPQGLHWHYNNADAPGQLDVDDAGMVQKFEEAAAKWTAVCGVAIVYDGATPALPNSLVNGGPDGISIIGWRPTGNGLQAATTQWSNTAPNGDEVLVDSDIMLDPALVTTPQILDAVLTHEWGHAIGLGHSPVGFALMSGPPDTAYSNLADLAPDDVQGCRCLYGLPANVSEGYICSLPSKVDYGTVNVGASSERQLDVTNTGTAALTMGSIQMQGGDFALTANQCAFGRALQPNATCRFTVASRPTVAARRQAEVILNTSAGPYRIPLSVQGAVAPLPPLNFEGAWWNSPPGSEDGWGLTLAHQDDVIFATWFTYDASHHPMWMSMSAFRVGTSNTFSGTLYRTVGPPLGAEPFDAAQVQRIQVGSGSLEFSDAGHGTFLYQVNNVVQARPITRLVFGSLPTCVFDGPNNPVVSTNYQGNWWEASGQESGWGIYLTHQGDNIFASWFTYDVDGSPMWLSATAARTSNGVYHGDVIKTAGPPFNTLPFPSQEVGRSTIGALTLTFANGNNASFAYSVVLGTPPSGISRTKQLTRLVLRPPGTLCD